MVYSEGLKFFPHRLKENDMPDACACHLQNSRVLFCTGIDHYGAETAVADMFELGGGE